MQGIFGFFRKEVFSVDSNNKMLEQMQKLIGSVQLSYANNSIVNRKVGLRYFGFANNCKIRSFNIEGFYLHILLYGKIFKFCRGAESMLNYRKQDDLEIIKNIYLKHGEGIGTFLDGEFNLVIYDEHLDKLLIVNDRFGFKNIYYYDDSEIFLFGPKIISLFAFQKINKKIDESALSDFFHFGYILRDKTFLTNVKLLRGGVTAFVESKKAIAVKQYWDFYSAKKNTSEELKFYVENAYTLLLDSVKKRIVENEKIIVQLSGGLDSRIITAMVKTAGYNCDVMTFGSQDCVETLIAQDAAHKMGIKRHLKKEIKPSNFVRFINETIQNTDGQCESLGISGPYSVIKELLSNNDYDLLLGGFCGDLVLGGKFLYKDSELLDKNINNIENYCFELMGGQDLLPSLDSIFNKDMCGILKDYRFTNLQEELRSIIGRVTSYGDLLDWFIISNRVLRYINSAQRTNTIYVKEFYPFFDYDFFDFIYTIPSTVRQDHFLYKEIYKSKFPNLAKVPWLKTGVDLYSNTGRLNPFLRKQRSNFEYIVSRLTLGKININNPYTYVHYDNWFRTDSVFRNIVEGILLDSMTIQRGYYKKQGVIDLLNMQKKGKSYFTLINRLFTFELWNRLILDGNNLSNIL